MKQIGWTRHGSERRIRWFLVAGLALAVAMAAVATASFTSAAAPKRSKAERIARGKQISFSSGCNDCHTPGGLYGEPDTTRLLSGSELGWEGPWGVTYPRNLTPDVETGIGSWSEADIITAIRQGHRPDGTPILPPMPWTAYAHMSDDDVQALAAFLKSLPPIQHKAPDRVPPGVEVTGARLTFPPPPAWDAKNLPPPPASAAKPAK